MAQETVTEFKTVEEKKTIHYCDSCGREADSLVDIAINPTFNIDTTWDVVKTYEDMTMAEVELQNIKEAKRAYDSKHGLPTAGGAEAMYRYGIGKRNKIKSANASASIEFCPGCVVNFFDVEIPEGEKITDVSMTSGGVTVHTTKEVTTIWPNLHHEPWANSSIVEGGWKIKTLVWPLCLFFAVTDYLTGGSPGDMERVKGYIGGSIGAIIWTAITVGILAMTGGIIIAS